MTIKYTAQPLLGACSELSGRTMISRARQTFRSIRSVLSIPRQPELVQAELAAFTKQVPLMYSLVIVNMTALAMTHYKSAPPVLGVYIPFALLILCSIRMFVWWRSRARVWTVTQAVKRLRGTMYTAGALGACFTGWSLSLFPYGDAYAKSHVAFFMAVTAIGCGFCLTHLRAAMLLIMALVVIPFAVFFCSTGNSTLILISINFVLVAMAVIFMLLVNYKGFEELVVSQNALRRNQYELQLLSDQNHLFSYTDSLTALPNRRSFFGKIEELVGMAIPAGHRLVVGVLDLDGFKSINDVYGHLIGDQLLVAAGERLRAALNNSVFLARLGGDEFVVVLRYSNDREVVDLGQLICGTIASPFDVGGSSLRVGATIGFACYPQTAASSQQLFEQADYALYYAKERSRGGFAVYSNEHEATVRRTGVVTQALACSNLENELWIAYQPIFEVKTGRPVAFEALARWSSPQLGDVSPGIFIPAAERSGMIGRVTAILLRKALIDASEWPNDIRLSFNLSAIDVGSPVSILSIIRIMAENAIAPSRIDFEVTETAVMRDVKQASEALSTLKQTGARIALDDFGTGFSSLSFIRELPLDEIKIDKSFVEAIAIDPSSRILIKSMINLCANLGLRCVIEGVETEDQLAVLKNEGAIFVQGYLLGKPMTGDIVPAFLVSQRPASFQLLAAS